ncbi:MAG: hypothetical protein IGBAC_0589 [Ignavibacteriae bacterium]|nr:MAG: hypothetical protein IGBAC_0589 [Ignavibacteriota bacterium]
MQINKNSFVQHNRLSILQFSTDGKNSFDYISGTEAIKSGLVKVTEISESGSVNNLIVDNPLDKYLFFSDGDILIGAKQNRVINVSMLLKPNSKTNIPVSCIERGRWRHSTFSFSPSEYYVPHSVRAGKHRSLDMNLRMHKTFYANQARVWGDVDSYSERIDHFSPTGDLESGLKSSRESYDEYLRHFKSDEEANGMAIFFDDKIVSIDVFNRDDIYKIYFPRLIQSAASETFYLKEKQFDLNEEIAKEKTYRLFSKLDEQQYVVENSPGAGVLKSFCDDRISGFMLAYEHHLIHLAILNLLNGENNRFQRFREFRP